MPDECVLVIDAGTSALRAVIVDRTGEARTISSEPWPIFVPEDAAPFGREFDGRAVLAALDRLIAVSAAKSEHISAIALTGQREGVVFADRTGEPVLASPNVDARASAEGIAIDAARGEEVYRVTGHLPSLMQAPAKLAWLRANRPGDASRVRWVLPLADWLAMQFTGVATVSRSLGLENGLVDVATDAVAEELLARGGMDAVLVPAVRPDGHVLADAVRGELTRVPVVLSGADTQCALAGMGATRAGDAGVPAGWSAPVQLVTDRPIIDCERRTWTGFHVLPNRWVLESNAGETGRAWDWLLSMTGLSAGDADALAEASPPGAGDVLAVLGPRTMRASEMNAGVGALTLPLPLVMSSPNRGDVARAVLEAAAFSIRANVEQLEGVSGVHIERLHVGGGMSRSKLVCQILSDVLDRAVIVARSSETSAVGAAALAFASLGVFQSADEAASRLATGGVEIRPNGADSATYEDCYERWCALSDEMARISGS